MLINYFKLGLVELLLGLLAITTSTGTTVETGKARPTIVPLKNTISGASEHKANHIAKREGLRVAPAFARKFAYKQYVAVCGFDGPWG